MAGRPAKAQAVNSDWETVAPDADEWETVSTPRKSFAEDAAALRQMQSKFDAPDSRSPLQVGIDQAKETALGGFESFIPDIQRPYMAPVDIAKGLYGTAKNVGGNLLDIVRGRGTSNAQQSLIDIVKGVTTGPRKIANAAQSGDWREAAAGAGQTLGGLLQLKGGATKEGRAAVSGAIDKAGDIVPVNAAARDVAERVYESGLKPGPRSNTRAEVSRMVDTGLDEGIAVSEAGMRKMSKLQEDINRHVAAELTAENSTVPPINKFKVASRLSDAVRKFSNQVNSDADLTSISDVGNEFLKNTPNDIDPLTAQSLKQGTYRQLKDRAFGELKNAEMEGQKHLARGLKEEIDARFPQVKAMNARNSDLFNLSPELEAAVNRHANKNLLGFGTPLLGAAVEMGTGSLPAAVATGAVKELISNPAVKSRLAIALARIAKR